MPRDVTVTVVECIAETTKAILCVVSDGVNPVHTNEVWIPRSVIEESVRDDEFKGDSDFELVVAKWFCEKEDIPYED